MTSTGELPANMRLLTANKAAFACAVNTDERLTQHLTEEGVRLMANHAIPPIVSQSPKPTFRQIPDGVLALGNPYATHLYGIMLQIGKRNRSITASWDTLATASNLNRKTVRKTIALLIEHGFVTTTHRYIGGRKASDSITLHDDPIVHIEDRMVHHKDYQWSATGTIDSPPETPLNGYVTDTNRYVIGDTPNETPVSQPTEEPMATDRGTRLPDGFALNDKMRADAQRLGIDYDIDWQLESFIDHHTAEGKPSKSWEASWRTWCRNAVSWNKRGPRTTAHVPTVQAKPNPRTDRVAWALAEKARLLAGEWETHYEKVSYTVGDSGKNNLAFKLARLEAIITGTDEGAAA